MRWKLKVKEWEREKKRWGVGGGELERKMGKWEKKNKGMEDEERKARRKKNKAVSDWERLEGGEEREGMREKEEENWRRRKNNVRRKEWISRKMQ